jgi:hypothetical protein
LDKTADSLPEGPIPERYKSLGVINAPAPTITLPPGFKLTVTGVLVPTLVYTTPVAVVGSEAEKTIRLTSANGITWRFATLGAPFVPMILVKYPDTGPPLCPFPFVTT